MVKLPYVKQEAIKMTDDEHLPLILNTMTTLSGQVMLWWVSATALSVAIFGLAGSQYKSLTKHPIEYWCLFALGAVFFVTVIISGLAYKKYFKKLLSGLPDICDRLEKSSGHPYPEANLSSQLPRAIFIGTTSFIIALIIWVIAAIFPHL